MFEKVVSLGSRLHYPITITKLLKSPGDSIKKQENIIEYKFTWRRKVGDDSWTDETTYTEFDSPAEGKLKEWRIGEGMVISADTPCMAVEEACGHEVQIQGLCSLCGADMTEVNWASEEKDTDRAMINMTHDQTGLMVSESVAMKAEHDTQKRLLRQRKLSLVVDLDQTIIHACIEPTVGEWQRDPSNPNHDAVKDVKSFQLNDDGPRGLASGCTYYIKLRPGLRDFLDEVAKMYELHVYTMGTRAYALNIARIVDPDRKLFGNRVISRDENGSITSKSLQRLFPVSTNMVVIIDDRSDVWPRNRPNLIKVVPYDFFKGIGDINSSFLPKRTDLLPAPPQSNGSPATPEAPAPEKQDKEAPKASPLDEIARMGSADNGVSLKVQAEEQEKTLEKQLTDRPLLHMQEELDRADELSAQGSETGDSAMPSHTRQHLLSDEDEELSALQDHLTDLHASFYETTKSRRRSTVDDGVDLSMVPDVGDILDELKSNVLSGLVIVLSGLVPLGAKVEESEIGMHAQSFGAQVLDSVSRRVTHLVVSTTRPRTKKVQQAAKIASVKIVNQNWLTDCLSQWRRLDERPYYLDILDADRERSDDTAEVASGTENSGDTDARDLKDFDWATADKDLEDFLGDDEDEDDDNDDESGAREDGKSAGGESAAEAEDGRKSAKRKKRTEDESDGDGPSGEADESVMAKKQRLSRNRGTSALRSVLTPNGGGGRAGEGDEQPLGRGANPAPTVSFDTNADFDDDALERELLAELEAAEA
ncbi:NLI interacting factor-like phosphatase domain-containing protein [Hirsutella rhossiliensis]|uniref:RNA polymerase II subunit A C-terminal domain phosphatase n=1 Tax=Hirsutella rhossiliensis TaxID=111463 RepID=A0A9P8MTZ4_9HYPO|nr:NLI interacting factor-like phosphatase domain-containing protein [Hirsutella rhossiliensis]KAH0960176.1 NLI interacting factor-like phosphatase domain-containing protein [Hirsutella rhossiliensis]